MTAKAYIYALYYDDFGDPQSLIEGPDEVPFYVGRSNDPERRLREHRSNSKRGQLDKDKFIRELEERNIEWSLKELRTIEEGDKDPWEYLYVIEYIRKGNPLKNMRFGDLRDLSEARIRKLADDPTVKTVADVRQAIERHKREHVEPSRMVGASLDVQLRAMRKSLRFLGVQVNDGREESLWDTGPDTEIRLSEPRISRRTLAELLVREMQPRNEAMEQVFAHLWAGEHAPEDLLKKAQEGYQAREIEFAKARNRSR